MTTYNTSRYRYIGWLPNRILEASELNRLQQIMEGVALDNITPWSWELGAVYAEGATFNVTAQTTGTTITLSATDNRFPMLVFVRGQWEILQSAEAAPVTLSGAQTKLYLNWWLTIRDSTVDPALVDAGTGEPTAEMGELVLQVSATDNSATALDSATYFQKNVSPTVLFTFAPTGTGGLTLVSSTGVLAQALAAGTKAGMVTLSTSTSAGRALASDDVAVTNTRNPNASSVADAAVRSPVLNGDGSTKAIGTGTGQDAGGISSAKIIHSPTAQLVSVLLEALRAQANATQTELAQHEPKALGNGVHVMPTAQQVGAAPASHVGLQLGLSSSHPPIVNKDSGGFQVIRNPGAAAAALDPGYAILMSNVLQAGLMHNGDVFSLAANASQAYPGAADGDGAQATKSLGLLSAIASVLATHVNKTSHKNPHGLDVADLGFSVAANYVKFPTVLGGLTIQWGHTSNIADGSPGTPVTFSPAFPTTCYAVVPAGDFASTGSRIISAASLTRTGFTLRADGSGEGAYWIAIGK